MVALGKKTGSGREILTAALTEVLKKPLFVSTAEKRFSTSPFITENPAPKPKPSRTADSQTDSFLPRPATKPFKPQKVGCDSSAQVDNSLVFDFDFEVAPLVNSLVSKIIDQVTLELHEETTLAQIRAFKRSAVQRRDLEISAWETTVAAESLRHAAAQADAARLLAERAALALTRRREFLKAFSARYLASLVPVSLGLLRRDFGVFENENMLEIERKFLPNLLDQVRTVQTHSAAADLLANSLLKHAN